MNSVSPDDLLQLSGVRLAALIRAGEISSREAVDAHIAQIERVNPTLNAVVAERYEEARAEAAAADDKQARGEDLPPFHGVPCTIKECFAFEGMPNTAGLVTRVALGPAREDATAVARLRAAGVVPLGVTNTSELCMWLESNNKVYGRTNNPYDPSRIVGGSSGGEGAIIAAGGSPFGLGSDIGGSIRLPAFFNGVFGHKPTGGLVPGSGQFPIAENEALRYLTTGPIARSAEDLMPFLRVVSGRDGIDAGCLDWELGDPDDVDLRFMKVIVIDDNGFRRVDGELRDAQAEAARRLESRGAMVEHVRIEGLRRSFEIWATMLGEAEEVHSFRSMLEDGRKKSMVLEAFRFAFNRSDHTLPAIVLAAVEKISPFLAGTPDNAIRMAEDLREELTARMGGGVLLFPSYTRPAPRHDAPMLTPLDFVYTGIFNVLEMPATQVPLGLSEAGLPLGVQVVGPRGTDHRTIAVARVLEEELGGWVPPACVPRSDAAARMTAREGTCA